MIQLVNYLKSYKHTRKAGIEFHRKFINFLFFLGKHQKPKSIRYEKAVDLHKKYSEFDVYKYDLASKRKRALERFEHLCQTYNMKEIKSIAELGAGDGQLALLFFQKGIKVNILEASDWRDGEVKAADITFQLLEEDECQFNLPDNSIDLFVSYNTFEHIANPHLTLKEMVRTIRPGGYIYLRFGPLYNSPWGLHAYRTFYAPYPQFILDKLTLQRFVDENGIYDLGSARNDFQYVNKWSFLDYHNLMVSLADEVEIEFFHPIRQYNEIWTVYRYLRSFWGRNLSFDELTTSNLEISLKKLI